MVNVPDHLVTILGLLQRAFPKGVQEPSYDSLLRVLLEDMSERNLAQVVGYLTGRDRFEVGNDVARVASRDDPNPAETSRVRQLLTDSGWQPEL